MFNGIVLISVSNMVLGVLIGIMLNLLVVVVSVIDM